MGGWLFAVYSHAVRARNYSFSFQNRLDRFPYMKLGIDQIRIDGGTQPRVTLNYDTVDDYSEAMKSGVRFPAITVFYDGESYWLADGFHRAKAAWQAELDEIEVDVRQGTRDDAQWFSFGANQSHGLRRTNEDKQRAVKAALEHSRSQGLSDREIAKHVGVSGETVRTYRSSLKPICQSLADVTRTVTRNGTTYQQNTANIGKRESIQAIALVAVADPVPALSQPTYDPIESYARGVVSAASSLTSSPISAEQLAGWILNSSPESRHALYEASEFLTAVKEQIELLGCVRGS